jgi:hypothetical protein
MEVAVRLILLVALGAAVAVSGRAQAPDAAATQPSSPLRVETRMISSQEGGKGIAMSGGVTFHFADGTQLSADEAHTSDWTGVGGSTARVGAGTVVVPAGAPREFILTGDVRLKLAEKSTFMR